MSLLDELNAWLSEAGKRHSQADQGLIQTMHDHAVTLGADCPSVAPMGEASRLVLAVSTADLRETVALREMDLSHGDISQALRMAIRANYPGKDVYPYVRDVYDDYVVYEVDNGTTGQSKLYQADYAFVDGKVTLGSPVEVMAVTQYLPVGEAKGEKPTKSEDGKNFPASDYAYVPDAAKPSTWKLRLTAEPGGEPDSGIVGAAAAALGKGFRGQKVMIPEGDLAKVKGRVRAAWSKANPDKKAEDMPDGIKESAPAPIRPPAPVAEAALTGDVVPLVEKSVRRDGTIPVKIIQPGWGSSGYYGADVLERDGPKVFPKGLKMYWNHPTPTEEAERPERDLRDLAAELVSDARWDASGSAGPGLYSDAKVFAPYKESVEDLAPHIGVSIRAMGKAKAGEAEGRKGPIIESLIAAKSVDFVTQAGAGGQVLSLFEAARSRHTEQTQPTTQQEADTVTEQEAQALRESLTQEQQENARLREALLLREARDFAAVELSRIEMPDLTRARLVETIGTKPVVTKEGKLDETAYRLKIREAAKAELEYIGKIAGTGAIRGMGTTATATVQEANNLMLESFRELGLSEGAAKTAAAGRN